ncbi:nucleic acid-binding protein [Trametopsis cervina]|nr:nucleic acid-binding protein [Trametopsis cervina]
MSRNWRRWGCKSRHNHHFLRFHAHISFPRNVAELNQITPDTALYYSFHTFAPSPVDYEPSAPPPTAALLGVTAALNELHNGGCSLATKSWVENHWGLILWKLAGMVCLDPKSESDPRRKRWCWGEVMRQLRYRYERELNRASRPPLRLIAAQDSPAGGPIVLCISSVTWIPAGDDEHGIPNEPNPVVEVTDGWYRMHAEVDEPLVRALRRGTLSVGKKVAVIGARLSSEKKDGAEILEGGGSLSLRISGNSSHLAPWHAKLGFQKDPFISMLGSLTSDGGTVAVCDVVIEKAYPIAYFEFIETPDGGRKREGPRNENEEAAAHDQWMVRASVSNLFLAKRDATASKLRSDVDAKLHALEGYAERLEPSAPDHIDDLLFELEEGPSANDVLKRVTATEAGWLARAIRDKIRKERECQGEDVSKELNVTGTDARSPWTQDLCPPREVRSFRVLVVRDATTRRRPSERSAQITVWDVLSAFVSEDGKAGLFKEGQRFVVTNLIPTQHSAWMPRGPDSVIYLATRRDSRWRRHK